MSHHYHFDIAMSCGGCSGAINRVLSKLEGIETHTVSLETQSADIHTKADADLSYGEVLTKIAKTGKKVKAGQSDGQEQSINPEDFA